MSIQEGTYIIESAHDDGTVSFGRQLSNDDILLTAKSNNPPIKLRVVREVGGFALLSSPSTGYHIVAEKYGSDIAVAATRRASLETVWAITSAGHGLFTIQIEAQDALWTESDTKDVDPPIYIRPADGKSQQRWKFVRIDRDD